MPTPLQYMQFSLGVYAASDKNYIDPPAGWTRTDWQPDQISGFSAGCYVNGSEIVISFTGTNDAADVANWTIGLGLPMPQIFAAVDYYFACKAAHPGANITFTGHSLGGGLASLMAVYFDKQATVFDEAPFQVAALNPLVTDAVGVYMIAKGYVDGSFADYLLSAGTLVLTREANVTHYYVEGEALNYPRYSFDTLVGTEYVFLMGSSTADPVERHSMALMTAMQYSSAFHDVIKKLPDLVTQLLDDKNLYAADARDEIKEDLLRKLLRHQFGVTGSFAADAMLDRFTSDLQKVAQDGGFTLTNTHITNTLVAFAMQMYYENPEAAALGKTLFTDVTGGIRFDRADVAANLNDAKGWQMYFQNYLNTLTLEEHRIVLQLLPAATDRFIQAGTISMSATAGLDAKKWIQVGNVWQDQERGITYGLVTLPDGSQTLLSDTVADKGWTDGELGIQLGAGSPPVVAPLPSTITLIAGDLKPFEPAAPGVQIRYDSLGNFIVGFEADPNRADVLYDSSGNDDLLDQYGGADLLEGGAGDDLLHVYGGNDWRLAA